jgi:enoyl reductase-like protein
MTELTAEAIKEMLDSFKTEINELVAAGIKPVKNTTTALDDLHEAKARVKQLEEELNKTKNSDVIQELERLKQEKEQLLGEKTNIEQTYTSKLNQMLINNTVTEALAKNNGSIKVLGAHLTSRLNVAKDDAGNPVVVPIDEKGELLTINNKPGTVDDLVESFKSDPEFAFAFKSNKVSGSGIAPSTGNGVSAPEYNPFLGNNLTEQSLLKKQDPEKAERLRKEAEAAKGK